MSILQLAKVVIRFFDGTLDVTADLPFHLCNFLPFIMLYVIIYNSKIVWGIVFVWIILGTSQANFTPVVENSLFYYDAIRYWINHCGLVIVALYPVFRWGWRLTQADVWRSLLWLNITAAVIFFVNRIFSSNYLYIMHKPPGTTAYSLLPEWPYYILAIEVLVIIFGYFLYFFFWLSPKLVPAKTNDQSSL